MSSARRDTTLSLSTLVKRIGAVLVICLSPCTILHAQTAQQKAALLEFSAQQDRVWHQQRAEAESLARTLGIPVRSTTPGGGVIELQKIVDGRAYYYRTLNLNAARTTSTNRVWPGGTGGFSLSGSTDTLAIWDADKARQTHQELTGRVIYSDAGTATHAHSTHVAGTMIAGGVDANAKGMSYQARLRSYDWDNDQSEMATAAASGLRVSNHSYGLITSWYHDGFQWHWYGDPAISTTEAYLYGFYSSDAQAVDNIAVNAPYYLVAKSSGNDRFEGPSSQPVTHSHSGSGSFTDTHNLSGAPSGYDCIADFGVAKNVLTVGAVNDIVAGYSVPGDVVMSSFSSWGPVDDGRIKPDLVANGVNVYSCVNTSNTAYDGTYSGTSMATPNVSGSLGLLLQLRKTIAGASNPMRSSTLKGLAIHTADESGSNPGPDYSFGWGLMNTLKAAQVMRTDSAAGMNRNIRELILSQGQTIDVTVNSNGLQALRATICWIDPAGTPPAPALDPITPMLVNDIDLRIIGGVTTYSPWVLNPASPASAATTGDNTRDNVEQVHLASPSAGLYTVRITHKGTLSGGSQSVSLIITGGTFDGSLFVVSPNGGESWAVGSTQAIQWNSTGVTGNVKIELSTNGGLTFPTVLFASTANDNSENWLVAGPVSSAARIRVSSVATPSVADTSNANFTIVQPSITVTSPNGGESWGVGFLQGILWTSTGIAGSVKVELSRNGGTSYETLFASIPNDGSEQWTATGPVSSSARIRISSVSDPAVRDSSNGVFSITSNFSLLAKIHLRDNGGDLDSLEYGLGAGATDGIDAQFGEFELPPIPPIGIMDVRWHIPGTLGTLRDIRDTLGGTRQQVIYTGKLQAGEGGYPFVLKWNPLELPAGTFTLRDGPAGVFFLVNMKLQDSLVITDDQIPQFQVVCDAGNMVSTGMQGGWNIVSLPVAVDDRRKTVVFPTSTSNAFAFTPAGYANRDTLQYGTGYWLKFPSAQTVSLSGELISLDTIDVVLGWNIIGSISTSVPVGNIVQLPGGIVASPYFGYSSTGYGSATSIDPMRGYWVKVNQNGKLVLPGSALMFKNKTESQHK